MKKITGGIYFLYNDDELVYIGKSQNIFQRIGSHIKEGIKEFNNWDYQEIDNENERSELEGYLINVFKPKYNEKMEYNSIFYCRRINHQRHWTKEKEIINIYEQINNYNWIPAKFLGELLGDEKIGYHLIHDGYIPKEYINFSAIYFVDKNWCLQNIDYLVQKSKECERKSIL